MLHIQHRRTRLNRRTQVKACMTIYRMYMLHFNLSTYLHLKVIIIIQCVQVKCISRQFAKNLNDFNIHLFGKPHSTLPVRLCTGNLILVPNFRFISEIFQSLLKNKNFILTLLQQNESIDSKLFQGKHFKLLTERLKVASSNVFGRGKFSNLQENWIAGGLFVNTPT